jgi:hypothetical protein
MATKQELIAAIRTCDERLRSLAEALRAQPEAPLLDGDWRVRDSLSHVAARADAVTIVRGFEGLTGMDGDGDAQAIFDIDAVNRSQIAARVDRGVDDLLREVKDGHRSALRAIEGMDDGTLARQIPMPGGSGETTFGDLVLLAGPRHEAFHVGDVERALRIAPGDETTIGAAV